MFVKKKEKGSDVMLKSTKTKIILAIAFVVIFVYALTTLSPFYYMVINSVKRIDDFVNNGPWGLPSLFYFNNYAEAVKLSADGVSFLMMYVNSFFFTSAATIITTITVTMTAYALARYRFPFRNLLVAVGVGSLVLPDFGSSSVVYKLFLDLNLINTFGILLKYTTPFGMQFLILYGTFCTISGTYVEAARIDGAGEWFILTRICLPMAKGAIGATMVILALNIWNDYYTPYMFLPSIKTLSIGLQELAVSISQLQRPKLFAGMVLSVLPIIIIFVSMRDMIIENTVSGGLKG